MPEKINNTLIEIKADNTDGAGVLGGGCFLMNNKCYCSLFKNDNYDYSFRCEDLSYNFPSKTCPFFLITRPQPENAPFLHVPILIEFGSSILPMPCLWFNLFISPS